MSTSGGSRTPAGVGARLRATAASQAIPSGAVTQVLFGTTVYDSSGMAGANTFTVPTTGMWQFVLTVNFAGSALGSRSAQILTSGQRMGEVTQLANGAGNRIQVTVVARFNSGNIISASVLQDSGVPVNLDNATPNVDIWFTATFEGT